MLTSKLTSATLQGKIGEALQRVFWFWFRPIFAITLGCLKNDAHFKSDSKLIISPHKSETVSKSRPASPYKYK